MRFCYLNVIGAARGAASWTGGNEPLARHPLTANRVPEMTVIGYSAAGVSVVH